MKFSRKDDDIVNNSIDLTAITERILTEIAFNPMSMC
jgi:hypothetical protein